MRGSDGSALHPYIPDSGRLARNPERPPLRLRHHGLDRPYRTGRSMRSCGASSAAAAGAMSRVMETLLFRVSATDPVTYGWVAAALVGVALVASWIPEMRAAGVDRGTRTRVDLIQRPEGRGSLRDDNIAGLHAPYDPASIEHCVCRTTSVGSAPTRFTYWPANQCARCNAHAPSNVFSRSTWRGDPSPVASHGSKYQLSHSIRGRSGNVAAPYAHNATRIDEALAPIRVLDPTRTPPIFSTAR